jgi:hypothetical protein
MTFEKHGFGRVFLFCSASFQLAFSCSQAGSLRYSELTNFALLEKPLFYVAGLVVWSSEMSHWPSHFKSDLNFAIEEKFREAGIEIPFPQRDLHIRSGILKTESTNLKM